MMNRITKKRHKSRNAFTLVEIIVVLVILAVIAAMIVPALTGYIKRAKEAKHIEEAEAYRVSMQAVVSDFYGKYGTAIVGTTDGTQTPNLRWDENPNIHNSEEDRAWGEMILELTGRDRSTEPYIMVFGVALENNKGISPYQVVYVGYLADQKSPSLFYVNGKWIREYPKDVGEVTKHHNKNYLVLPDKSEVEIRFFVVSNRTDTDNKIWIESAGGENTLQGHSASGHYGY